MLSRKPATATAIGAIADVGHHASIAATASDRDMAQLFWHSCQEQFFSPG